MTRGDETLWYLIFVLFFFTLFGICSHVVKLVRQLNSKINTAHIYD